jgi:hypothetical protein
VCKRLHISLWVKPSNHTIVQSYGMASDMQYHITLVTKGTYQGDGWGWRVSKLASLSVEAKVFLPVKKGAALPLKNPPMCSTGTNQVKD